MATLIGIHELSKSFGSRTLFDNIRFGIESGERIGLIGPNGAGKTTLLKILAGQMAPDGGTISYQKGLKTGFLGQVPLFREGATVHETVMEGLAGTEDTHEDWERDLLVEKYTSRLHLDPTVLVSKLSGGWKKRVALARELVKQPDLLFLDEPTNHLDVETILWLENFLANAPFATLTVTHDRLFLQRVSNRILELDRRNPDGLLSIKGDYAAYLEAKEQLMSAQERHETVLKNTLRRETEWLRRGPKARTTKQQARINRAGELKDTVSELSERNKVRTAKIDFQNSALPKRLLEATNISKAYGSRKIFSPLNLLLSPGTRIGLLGANGVGKSTLIRVLLGKEKPDQGKVEHAEQLQVAYFEQNRETLNPEMSLAKTLCPYGDHVDYRGKPVHIKSYLDRFLFTPIQGDLAVGRLSGGEQSRILIARLMLQPANLLVLDEPTNDLDMATLNILQDCLTEFEGAIILVTHDRYFLDQVANKILAFPSEKSKNTGKITSFSDLEQWEEWFQSEESVEEVESPKEAPVAQTPKKKLTYKDQREFDGMEAKIQKVEEELNRLQKESEASGNASNAVLLSEIFGKMEKLKIEIDALYARWSELGRLANP